MLIQTGGSIGLPEASRAYAGSGWQGLLRVSRAVTVAGLASGLASLLAVAVWGRRLLALVYGPAFAHLQTASVIIGVGFVSLACLLGPVLVLKATRNTRFLFQVEVVSLVVSVTSAAALASLLGLDGAALSVVVTSTAAMAMLRWYQHGVARKGRAGGRGVPPVQPVLSGLVPVASAAAPGSGAPRPLDGSLPTGLVAGEDGGRQHRQPLSPYREREQARG
ncbi:MAG: hypothetical protein ACRDZX_18835 [Acidimicrobiales bacterium]